jgi:hypothetical protein
MTRTLSLLLPLVLCLSAAPMAASQAAPEAYRVVERFAEAINAGRLGDARAWLAQNATWSEYDLDWRVATGRLQVGQRAQELIQAGVRLETELVAIVGGGTMAVTHERMWGAFVPEDLTPMRSTTVYVVEAGRLISITRVLATDQRDALMTAATGGVWGCRYVGGVLFFRHSADGTFHMFRNRTDLLAERPYDGGTYAIVEGVITYVTGDDSEVCDPGDRVVFRLRMTDADTVHLDLIRDETTCAYRRSGVSSGSLFRAEE